MHANIYLSFFTRAIMELEDFMEKEKISGTDLATSYGDIVSLQYEPNDTFNGLDIYASDNEVFKKL